MRTVRAVAAVIGLTLGLIAATGNPASAVVTGQSYCQLTPTVRALSFAELNMPVTNLVNQGWLLRFTVNGSPFNVVVNHTGYQPAGVNIRVDFTTDGVHIWPSWNFTNAYVPQDVTAWYTAGGSSQKSFAGTYQPQC